VGQPSGVKVELVPPCDGKLGLAQAAQEGRQHQHPLNVAAGVNERLDLLGRQVFRAIGSPIPFRLRRRPETMVVV
jgi:hypothetical protein